MSKTTILIVSSPPLARIIEYLFHDQSEFEVIRSVSGVDALGQPAGRFAPELIVANVKPVSIGICRAVTSIKMSNPLSRLILICPINDLARAARRCGADACLKDEKLTGHLLRTARTLAERRRMANAGN